MAIDERLAKKGTNEPREGPAQQGKVSLELAKAHAVDLAVNGWSADDTTAFEAHVVWLDSNVAKQPDEKGGAGAASTGEQTAIDAAKTFVRRLRNALPRALRETKAAVAPEAFHAGVTLGRSTPKLSGFLTRIRPAVLALDADLAKHFGGQSAVAQLDAVKLGLDTADAAQEVALSSLPEATQKVYEAKGRVLEAIEDLNRAGKTAYDGNTVVAAKFNKDVLLRVRKARKAGVVEGKGEAPVEPAPV